MPFYEHHFLQIHFGRVFFAAAKRGRMTMSEASKSSNKIWFNLLTNGLIASVVAALVSGLIGHLNTRSTIDANSSMHYENIQQRLAQFDEQIHQWETQNTIQQERNIEIQAADARERELFAAEMSAREAQHQQQIALFRQLIQDNSNSIALITSNQDQFMSDVSARSELNRSEDLRRLVRRQVLEFTSSARTLNAAIVALEATECQEIVNRETVVTPGHGSLLPSKSTRTYRDEDCTPLDAPRSALINAIATFESKQAVARTAADVDTVLKIQQLNNVVKVSELKVVMRTDDYKASIAAYIISDEQLARLIDEIEILVDN